MILFVYGMVGWIWFGDELPDQRGDIGSAMLTRCHAHAHVAERIAILRTALKDLEIQLAVGEAPRSERRE